MEWGEEYLSHDDYIKLLSKIDKTKIYNISDEEKQHICNVLIRKLLLGNNVIKSYQVKEWLENQRDNYREMIAYVKRENTWKKNTE